MSRSLKESTIAFIDGKTSAFDDIYAATYRKVYVTAKILMKNEQDIEDVVQEVYIQAYNNLNTIKDPGSVMAWLQVITRNISFNKLKGKKEIILDEESEYIMDNLQVVDTSVMPEMAFMNQERNTAILSMVSELPVTQRDAVLLHYIQAKSIADVAFITDSTPGTVKSRLNYARIKLREMIEAKEKKDGVKLYGVGFVFLPFILRYAAGTMPLSEAVAGTALHVAKSSLATGTSQGSTVGSSLGKAASYAQKAVKAAVSGKSGASGILAALGTKMVAIILVATFGIASLGTIAAVRSVSNQRMQSSESVSTQIDPPPGEHVPGSNTVDPPLIVPPPQMPPGIEPFPPGPDGLSPMDMFDADAVLEEIAVHCASGRYDDAFALMYGNTYSLARLVDESSGDRFIKDTSSGKIGVFTPPNSGTLIYFGDFSGDNRHGEGLWLRGDSSDNYFSRGTWANDIPNGMMHVEYRGAVMVGNVQNGFWEGEVSFEGDGIWLIPFENGKFPPSDPIAGHYQIFMLLGDHVFDGFAQYPVEVEYGVMGFGATN